MCSRAFIRGVRNARALTMKKRLYFTAKYEHYSSFRKVL